MSRARDQAELSDRVAEALRNAGDNGYNFAGWSDQAIAVDMLTYDGGLEDEDLDAVTAALHDLRRQPAHA